MLLPVLVVAIVVAQKLPKTVEYEPLLWLVFALTVKVGLSTGTESKIPVSLLFVAAWGAAWLGKMALGHRINFARISSNWPSLFFLTLVAFSLVWGRFQIDPQIIIPDKFINVQLGTIGVTVLSVALFILCLNLVRRVSTVKAVYMILLFGSLYYLPLFLTQTRVPINVETRGLFPLWFCSISLSLLLNQRQMPRWQRFLIALALVGWIFRLFVVTLVRISSWLPALIGMLVILFLYSRKWFLVVCLVGGILVVLNYQLLFQAIVVAKEEEGTLAGQTSRESLWAQAYLVAQDHLVLGTGPAGYANYYLTYFRDHALSTHNNYLDVLLQYGLLGIGAFLWLCYSLFNETWKSIRVHEAGSFEKAFSIGCFGGICGMLPAMWLGDWVIPFAYNQTISGFDYTGLNWFFIGLGLSLSYHKIHQTSIPPAPVNN